jgi:hypothetical protein
MMPYLASVGLEQVKGRKCVSPGRCSQPKGVRSDSLYRNLPATLSPFALGRSKPQPDDASRRPVWPAYHAHHVVLLFSHILDVPFSVSAFLKPPSISLTRLLRSVVERPHMTFLSKSGLTNEFLPQRSQRLVDPAGPSFLTADQFRQVVLFSR